MKPADERQRADARTIALLAGAAEMMWDIAVIGAGSAGSVAAALLAGQGKRVVLIEKSTWPREKVCGGCLNAAATEALGQAGLASSFSHGQLINRAIWYVGGRSLEMATPGGVAILRSDLDAALVNSAQERGCMFLSDTTAKILPGESRDEHRLIQLRNGGATRNIRAKVVLACDGIAGTSVETEPWATWRITRNAWMGASGTCENFHSAWSPGAIHMHIGDGGYVGAVRLPDGRIHLAAALDPIRCRNAGGPAPLVEKILRSCGQNIFSSHLPRASLTPSPGTPGEGRGEGLLSSTRKDPHPNPLQFDCAHRRPDYQARGQEHIAFRGTGLLTRRREHLGGHRVLAVGDACGYVEPFTGEGMAWAIRSAIVAADLLLAMNHWPEDLPARWANIHRNLIQQKQHWCKALRPLVHHPSLALLGITSASAIPAIANFLSHRICESDCPSPAPLQGAIG